MDRNERLTAFAWLCVRVVLALVLVFAVAGLLQGNAGALAKAKPWIGPDAPSIVPPGVYAVLFGTITLLLLTGWQLSRALIALSVTLIFITVERLVRNPFTNLTADVATILVLGLAVLVAGPERDQWRLDRWQGRREMTIVDRWSWVTLFIRLFVGAIFFTQGVRNLFLGAGPITFAERLYVKPFAGMMPEPLLWIAGVSNPFVQFGVGLLLIVGLLTRPAAAIGTLFLTSIIFGHLMEGPLTAPMAMRDFATANFIAMVGVMLLASIANRWSLDALLFRRKSE